MFELLTLMTILVLGQSSSAMEPPRSAQPPTVVVLDDLEDLYEPVQFDHLAHAGMAAMGDGCVVCHHHTPETTPHPACRSCHSNSPQQSWSMPGLKGAYHRQCLACHTELSHRTACSVCHLPKVGTAVAEAEPFHGDGTGLPSVQAQAAYVFETTQEAPVITFHHIDHARVFGLSCADCHHDESCAGCHDPGAAASTPEHRDLRARCFACHDVQARQDCRFCHSRSTQADSFNHADAVGWSLEPDHIDLACANCHGAADVFATPSPRCSACHSEKGIKRFDHQVMALERACGECHGEVASAAAGVSYGHPPLEQGCGDCHDPRASDHPFFLLEAESTLCFACHESVKECYQGATVMHGPASEGYNCTTCHKPHGSTHRHLLSRSSDKLCLGCHDRSIQASDGRTLTNIADRLSASLNRHVPVREDNCTRCHQPHAGVRDRRLRDAYPASFYAPFADGAYDLCFGCHDEQLATAESPPIDTGFRDGDTNLHWMHLNREKGRTCRVCHDPHASDMPFLIREFVQFDAGQWSFPMGFEQTPLGGRCAPACHAPMEYRRVKMITGFD